MDLTTLLLAVCGLIMVVMIVLAIKANKAEKQVTTRMSSLTMVATPQQSGTYINRQKVLASQNFNERVLFPFAQKVFDKTQRLIPLSSKSWVRSKLIQAGLTSPQYPKIFLGIQLLASGGLLACALFITQLMGRLPGMGGLVLSGVIGGLGYTFPLLWLIQQAQDRSKSIQKSLPDFLDILVICVEAGLGLDTAIQRIANLQSVKTSIFLKQELQRYCKDLNLGKPRKEALIDLGQRSGLEDFNTVVGAPCAIV
jgi:tight adherence protein C